MSTTTIALVEEDDVSRLLHAKQLRGAGYRVIEQRTAERVVALMAEESPALWLLDRSLRGESGFEACRRIVGAGRSERVVILAANSSFDDVRFAMVAGAQRLLPKAFKTEAIDRLFRAPVMAPLPIPMPVAVAKAKAA